MRTNLSWFLLIDPDFLSPCCPWATVYPFKITFGDLQIDFAWIAAVVKSELRKGISVTVLQADKLPAVVFCLCFCTSVSKPLSVCVCVCVSHLYMYIKVTSQGQGMAPSHRAASVSSLSPDSPGGEDTVSVVCTHPCRGLHCRQGIPRL